MDNRLYCTYRENVGAEVLVPEWASYAVLDIKRVDQHHVHLKVVRRLCIKDYQKLDSIILGE